MKLERTIEQWRGCEPRAMACMSPAAIEFALKDARHDILALAEQRDALLKSLHDVLAHFDKTSYADAFANAAKAIVRAES